MYPGPYRNASDCTWEISVPVGFKVGLKFVDFDIGSEELCLTDYVKVEDIRSTTFYCGKVRLSVTHFQIYKQRSQYVAQKFYFMRQNFSSKKGRRLFSF